MNNKDEAEELVKEAQTIYNNQHPEDPIIDINTTNQKEVVKLINTILDIIKSNKGKATE